MAKSVESPEATALSTAAAELARNHHATCLYHSLLHRLWIDGQDDVRLFIEMYWNVSNSAGLDAERTAGALVARLRVDGAGEVADALISLMTRAAVAPVLAHPIPLDEHKKYPQAARHLQRVLSRRLEIDGHRELANAVDELIEDELRRRGPGAMEKAPRTPPPERVDRDRAADDDETHMRSVAAAHDARVLLAGLIARLHGDGRDFMAGYMMAGWLEGVVGPLVDPREAADALVESLRKPEVRSFDPGPIGRRYNEPMPEVADAIASLLDGAPIDRDPEAIMSVWLQEVAGPVVEAAPLGAALVEALRRPGHADHAWLADAVLALLQGADLPVLDPGSPHVVWIQSTPHREEGLPDAS